MEKDKEIQLLFGPYLDMIKSTILKEATTRYILHYWDMFRILPGSLSHHHFYEGGFVLHILEVLEDGLKMIDTLSLDVNKDNFIVAALIHDVGKIWEYKKVGERWEYVKYTQINHALRPLLEFTEITGVILPEEIAMAILSHEGGWSRTSANPEKMLEVILHCADLISSRKGNSNKSPYLLEV